MEPVSSAAPDPFEFDGVVAQLEEHFSQHDSYPSSLDAGPGYIYDTDGEDFELTLTDGGREIRYSSRDGYLLDKEAVPAAPRVWELKRQTRGWGPWQQESYEELTEFAGRMPELCAADLRVQLRSEAVPQWIGKVDPAYRHFEMRLELEQRNLEIQAYRAPEAPSTPPALSPLPDRAFALVGDPEFLSRLGIPLGDPRKALVFSQVLDQDSAARLGDFMAHGERFTATGDAGEPELWAHGRFRFEDRDGKVWDCRWKAGKEVQHDWVRLSWEPHQPLAEGGSSEIPTRSCDYEDDFSRRRTVASHHR